MITRHLTIVCNRFALLLVCIVAHNKLQCVNGQAQPVPLPQEQPPAPIPDGVPTVPWYETLPAVAMDYKVIVDPGKEDCYFQFVNPGATFYASAQVLIPTLCFFLVSVLLECETLCK